MMPIGGRGGGAGDAAHDGPGLRHAAALQPGRQAHRLHQRPRRPGNIWVMDADGKNPPPCRQGELLAVNSPTWAPDGDFIFARKHFMPSARSAPARCGCTTAAAATACRSPRRRATRRTPASRRSRPTAATSTTARTSRPARPSSTTRTPTPRSTRSSAATGDGRERAIVSGAGGAIRRAVSPDGKSLAFIRRVAPSSRCSSADLAHRRRAADLRRTSTATCRKPGRSTAPTRSTPGRPTQGMVFWGEGKIWRVDLPTAAAPSGPCRPAADPVRAPRSSRRSPRRCASR